MNKINNEDEGNNNGDYNNIYIIVINSNSDDYTCNTNA